MTDCSDLRETLSKTVQWKIPKFFDRPMLFDYSLSSSKFSLPGTKEKCFFRINSTNFSNSVNLGIIRETPDTECSIVLRMGIKKVNGLVFKAIEKKITSGTTDLDSVIGPSASLFMILNRPHMLSWDVVAPDGSLTVFCTATTVDEELVPSPSADKDSLSQTGTVIASSQAPSSVTTAETASQTTWLDGNSNLFEDFKNVYISRHTDVTLLIKNEEFRAHRSVLASHSQVFASMFQHEMAEKLSGKVEICDCDPDTFEEFLLFLYTRKLNNVSSSEAMNLYKTANKYDVKQLRDICVDIMRRDLCVDSFYDVFQLANMHFESDLFNAAIDFFVENANTFISSTEFLPFLQENMSLFYVLYRNVWNEMLD